MPSTFVNDIIDKYYPDPRAREILVRHSGAIAEKAKRVVENAGMEDRVDMQFLEDAAMLHDIGIIRTNAPGIYCFGELPYICHGTEGKKILDDWGLDERYGHVCERHTGSGLTEEEIIEQNLPLPHRDFLPETLEEKVICYADKFFSKSKDLEREKTLEEVEKSMARHSRSSLERFRSLHRMFSLNKHV